jgi:hypothetical protein
MYVPATFTSKTVEIPIILITDLGVDVHGACYIPAYKMNFNQ